LLDTIWNTVSANPTLEIIRHVSLFDVWHEPSEQASPSVSLGLRFWLQDQRVTLEDERVEQCLQTIRAVLETAHDARQR
jgi:phenylalanyl-tRNA synthetase beta subunit